MTERKAAVYVYIIIVLILLASVPLYEKGFVLETLILIMLYATIALLWGFMAKHAGIVSLGQQLFIGLSGYAAAIFSMYFGLPIWLSVSIAGVVSGMLASVLSFPLLKLRGMYFALGSFLVAEVVRLLFSNWDYINAGAGLIFKQARFVSKVEVYYACMVLMLVSIALVYYTFRSKFGYGLRSIGADEVAASGLGVNTFRCKAYCFIVTSLLTGFAGAINAVHHVYLNPASSCGVQWTINTLFTAVIGGIGTVIGPIIGSTVFVSLGYILSQYLGLSLLLEGLVVIAILLVIPEGIWGSIRAFISKKWSGLPISF